MLILDVFEYFETENIDGLFVFLDFEKAFDSVELRFLFKALHKFNIGKLRLFNIQQFSNVVT